MAVKFGLLLWIVCLGCLWIAPKAQAADHLDCPSTLKRVCEHASAQPLGSEVLASFPRDYLKKRLDRLTTVYSVDVGARAFDVVGYNLATQQLKLNPQARYALFNGEDALELIDAPLIVFEVSPEVAEQIALGRGTGRVSLRLFFLVESLLHPEADYCNESESEALTIRGKLLGARLWQPQKAGDETLETVLANFDASEGWDTARVIGLSMTGGAYAPPRLEVKLSKVDGALSKETRAQMSRDIELALMPCYFASLGKGGPKVTTLKIKATFAERRIKKAEVQTEVSPSPVLRTCAESTLRRLGWSAVNVRSIVFYAFFDRG